MLDMISNFLTTVDDFVWGIPLIALLALNGVVVAETKKYLDNAKKKF